MSDSSYTLLDAMREEVKFLHELQTNCEKTNRGLLAAQYREQNRMLSRILNRFENGKDYYLGVKDGETMIMQRQTTRHLEREYPAVATAKRNLDTVVDLTKGKDNV